MSQEIEVELARLVPRSVAGEKIGRDREVERKRKALDRQIGDLRSDYEGEALELRRIAEQVGTRSVVLGTERAASGLLRRADTKVAANSRSNHGNGNGKAGGGKQNRKNSE